MNKKGKGNMALTIGAFALVALLAISVYAIFFRVQQTSLGSEAQGGAGTYISTGSTALALGVVDELEQGTTVGGTSYIKTNDGPYKTGTTTASPGNKLSILFVNNTAYHNAYLETTTVPESPTFDIPITAKENATVTITVFNTNGVVVDGGVTNQTITGTGNNYNMKIRMDGEDKASTQDMLCILEGEDGAEIQDMTLSGFGAAFVDTSKPNWYTSLGTSSIFKSFKLTPIEGSVSPEGVMGIQMKSSMAADAASRMKITCVTYENFLDSSTGKVLYDVEDTQGNLKSIATYSATVYFQ